MGFEGVITQKIIERGDEDMSINYDLDAIHKKHLNEIEKQFKIYKEAKNNPELIITDMFNPEDHQPYYNIMHYVLKKTGGIDLRSLQKIIYKQLKDYFEVIDKEIKLEIDYGSMVVHMSYKGKKFMHFSVYSHAYVDDRYWISWERYQRGLESDLEFLCEFNKRLDVYQEYKFNLFSMLKKENYNLKGFRLHLLRLKEVIQITFKQRKIRRKLEIGIKKTTKEIIRAKESIERQEEKIEELKLIEPDINAKYKEWEQRFIDWGYKKSS